MKIVNVRLTDDIWKRIQVIQKIQPYKAIHLIIMEAIDQGLKNQEQINDSN